MQCLVSAQSCSPSWPTHAAPRPRTQTLERFFHGIHLLAALHLFASASGVYIIGGRRGIRPGQLNRATALASLPAAATRAFQVRCMRVQALAGIRR